MHLTVSLQDKVEELFFTFITDKAIQRSLKQEIGNLLNGQPVGVCQSSPKGTTRARPMSPPAPPPSNQQPRSPRLSNKNANRIFNTSLQINSHEDTIEEFIVDSSKIPNFYFPFGRQASQDQELPAIIEFFSALPERTCCLKDFGHLARVIKLESHLCLY